MALVITFLNSRESSMPYQSTDADGNATFERKYQATIQILVEGDTRDVLNFNASLPENVIAGAGGGSIPNDFNNITIDDQNSFAPSADLHPGSTVKNSLLYSWSEIAWNYDKVSAYGKITGTLTLDVIGPIERLNQAGDWEIADPIQY